MSKTIRTVRRSTKSRRETFEYEDRVPNAIVVHELPKKKFTLHDLNDIAPLTYSQERVFDLWRDDYSMVLSGSAGTGKSLVALFLALQEVLSGKSKYKKVIIVRSAVQTREIGHLKGDLSEKTEVYELPYIQLCNDIFCKYNQYKFLKESGIIEFVTTSFVRGLTFKDCIVIADEFQNCNYGEISTVVSRLGNNAKIVLCGDTKQNDLITKRNEESGMAEFVEISKMIPSFRNVHFTVDDIVRSGLVKEFLMAEERYNELKTERLNSRK